MIDRLRIAELLLRPFVRFCLRYSVAIQDISPLLKRMLLDAAAEEIKKTGKRVNASRLYVATGISRREIAELNKTKRAAPQKTSLTARVIVQWEQDRRFSTASRKPKLLSFEGPNSEFARLVRSVSKECDPASTLFELKRVGLVEQAGSKLKLQRGVQYFTGNVERAMEILANDCEMLTTVVEENVYNPRETRNLHLRTDFDNIYEEDLPQIRKWLFEQGAAFHKRARTFLSRFDGDISPRANKTPGERVALGSFGWTSWGNSEGTVTSKRRSLRRPSNKR